MREPAGEPAGALVLLHGRGASEHDLFPLLDALDPGRRLVGYAPGAPLALPPGGRHWYRLGGIPTPEPQTFLASVQLLTAWLAGLEVPQGRLVLGGFSQGCVMSYALALGPVRVAPVAVVAMSGFLPRVPGYPLDPTRLAPTPVWISHGTVDPVIGVQFGREAVAVLETAGVPVTFRETPVPHMIDPDLLPDLVRFVHDATS